MTDGSDEISRHPDLGGVGAAMRSQWAAEQQEATADAQEDWQRRQTFRDWLADAMHAGDRLAVTIVDQRFTGTVEEVGDDLLGVRCIFGRVDLHLLPGIPMHIELVDHPASGGHRGRTDGVFAACLAARDPKADTSVGTVFHPQGIDGQVTAGRDFLTSKARAGAITVIPLAQVAWVSARRE
jgi:hypothetical protein